MLPCACWSLLDELVRVASDVKPSTEHVFVKNHNSDTIQHGTSVPTFGWPPDSPPTPRRRLPAAARQPAGVPLGSRRGAGLWRFVFRRGPLGGRPRAVRRRAAAHHTVRGLPNASFIFACLPALLLACLTVASACGIEATAHHTVGVANASPVGFVFCLDVLVNIDWVH